MRCTVMLRWELRDYHLDGRDYLAEPSTVCWVSSGESDVMHDNAALREGDRE